MSSPWHGAIIPMVRVLINDNTQHGNYTYTDSRLIQTIIVAAHYVYQEVYFTTTYDIDTVYNTISPDPYTIGDKVFMNMVSLKAACLIDQGQFRCKALMSGLEAKCGPTTIKTSQYLAGFENILKLGPCALYEELKMQNAFSGEALNNIIHFVLSPFSGNEFDPSCLQSGYDNDRMMR